MAILLIVVWSKKSSENFGRNYLKRGSHYARVDSSFLLFEPQRVSVTDY